MMIARYVEAGSQLYVYQHAASYGEVEGHLLHHVESSFANRFRTWGWRICANDESYVALRLLKPPAFRYRAGWRGTYWIYMILRQPLRALIDSTLATQECFFGALKTSLAGKILIRPHTQKRGHAETQIIEEARRSVVAIDDGTSLMADLIKYAELLILDDFPSTAFLECAIGDVPVLAIVPAETEFTQIARAFYDEFFAAGLLHRSPESAAAFLNQLDVKSWWRHVSRQPIFLDYIATFANRDTSRLPR
jgi:putative transferase (TIGR04331 family)